MPEVIIYTRMFCGFCTAAKSLLDEKGVEYTEFDGTFDQNVRSEMIEKSNGGNTFPQIFINNEHIGGCDDLYGLDQSGKLDEKLGV